MSKKRGQYKEEILKEDTRCPKNVDNKGGNPQGGYQNVQKAWTIKEEILKEDTRMSKRRGQ